MARAAIKALYRNGVAYPFVVMPAVVMVVIVAAMAATAAVAAFVLLFLTTAASVFVIFAVAKRRITAINGHI